MSGTAYSVIPQFHLVELTAAINKVPLTPSLLGNLRLFTPKPLSTVDTAVEQRGDTLALVPSQPRGAPADIDVAGGRSVIPFRIPHFPIRDTVMADSIQGVRAFGSDSQLEGWANAVNEATVSLGQRLDVTEEWLRVGAVTGTVITAVDRESGAPKSYIDLFASFGVTPPAVINFPMEGATTEASAWSGAIMAACRALARQMQAELGQPAPGIGAICGASFFDALAASAELRQTFLNTPQAGQLRQSGLFIPVFYGGIQFFDYGITIGNLALVPDDEARFFPIGVPDLFVASYAPADYAESVNTMALPRYLKPERMPFDKGVMLEAQMNVLPLCTRPRCLITGKLTAAPAGAGRAVT